MTGTIAATVVSVALVVAVAVLTWHGDIPGDAAIAFFSAVAGGGVVAGANHVAVQTAAQSNTK